MLLYGTAALPSSLSFPLLARYSQVLMAPVLRDLWGSLGLLFCPAGVRNKLVVLQ